MKPSHISQVRLFLMDVGLFVTLALGTSCIHLDPPIRATPEQAQERQMESPPSSTIQARPDGGSPDPCTVSFDDRNALSQTFAQSRTTFTIKTGQSPSGRLEQCDERIHSDCWFYRQRCTRNNVNIDPINYGHFHLSFERPVCLGSDGHFDPPDPGDGFGWGFGREREGVCDIIDWTIEPRVLDSHLENHWIKIWVGNARTQTPTYFDIDSIWVLPDKPIQVWFRTRGGIWWFWPEIRPSGIWNVSEWVRDVSEVRIRGAESSFGSYRIGAFVIRD